jgi:hypothetical protein
LDNGELPETTKPRHHWDARGFLDKLGFRETPMWAPTGIEKTSVCRMDWVFARLRIFRYPHKYPRKGTAFTGGKVIFS